MGLEEETAEAVGLLRKQAEILESHADSVVSYDMTGRHLFILHTLVCMAAESEAFQDIGPAAMHAVRRFRDFAKQVWIGQGFTAEEARILDEITHEVRKGRGVE